MTLEVGLFSEVVRLFTVGISASKVKVKVCVAEPQVESTPPQLPFPIAGRIVIPEMLHEQLD